jgi:hypothetical protein
MKKKQTKNIAIFAFSLMAIVGTYNAVMINSESGMSGSKNFKRLDEMFGNVTHGRTPAVTAQWTKIEKPIIKTVETKSAPKVEVTATQETPSHAAIQDSLALKLVEVMNPKKWEKGVQATEFSGSISTNNGIIETLSANLPQGINIDISFSEMTGNTFEYDLNGEVYAGMMYQVDQGSYMITMSNGPLEGTRLRFADETINSEAQAEQTQTYLAETHKVEVGTFGEEMEPALSEVEADTSIQTAEAPSFNFNQI